MNYKAKALRRKQRRKWKLRADRPTAERSNKIRRGSI